MPKQSLIPHRALLPQALSIVPYLTREEVSRLAAACQGRNRLRDELLIHTLFQTGMRISEALSLTPRRIGTQEGGAVLYILGKGGKSRLVTCPDSLAPSPQGLRLRPKSGTYRPNSRYEIYIRRSLEGTK